MESIFHFATDLLATLIGVQLYLRSKQDDTLTKEQRFQIIVGALFGALIGSRLIAALEDPTLFMSAADPLYYAASKTIIGGIAGGIIGIEIVKRFIGISTWTGDRTVVPLIVAIIIGRIGCFVSGVQDMTVGGPCDYFWCLEQGDGILRHPNSLYEITFLTMFLIGYQVAKQRQPRWLIPVLRTPGAAFRVLIVTYFSLRFSIEFLKDTNPLIFGINSIQIVCLLFVLWYIKDLISVYRNARQAQ